MMVSYRTYGVLICCPYLLLIIAFHSYIQLYEKVPTIPDRNTLASGSTPLLRTELSQIMALEEDLSTHNSHAVQNNSNNNGTNRERKHSKIRLRIRQADNKAKPASEINHDTRGLVTAATHYHKKNETLNSTIHNAKPDKTLNSAIVSPDKRVPSHTSHKNRASPPVKSHTNTRETRHPFHQADAMRLGDNMSNNPHDVVLNKQPHQRQSNEQMTGGFTGDRQSVLLHTKQDKTPGDTLARIGNEQRAVHIDTNHKSTLVSSASAPPAQSVSPSETGKKVQGSRQDKSITHPSSLNQTTLHHVATPSGIQISRERGLKRELPPYSAQNETSTRVLVVPTGLPLQSHCAPTQHANRVVQSIPEAQQANTGNQNGPRVVQSDFQEIRGTYFYSAYLDDRVNPTEPVIKIMSLVKRGTRPALFCHFISPTMAQVETAPVEHYEMCENHAKEYGGWFLTCALPVAMVSNPPCHVTVSTHRYYKKANEDSIQLPILRLRTAPHERKHDFTVCIPPLFGHIPSTTLIEFIELTHLLGATHLTFYSLEVSREVRRVLDYYAGIGLASVLPWHVPLQDKSVWYHAQLLSINDCLYRSVHRAKRTAFHDLDEFIVPHQYANWSHLVHGLHGDSNHSDANVVVNKSPLLSDERDKNGIHLHEDAPELIQDLSDSEYAEKQRWLNMSRLLRHLHDNSHLRDSQWAVNESQYCGYSFQSAFFDPLNNGNSRVLYDLESDLRTKTFSKVRAKVMVMPERIEELGIHHISKPIDRGLQIYHVTPEQAYIHHYRQCMTDFDPKMKCQIFTRDERMSRYIPYLRHNVHDVTWLLKEADRRGITDYRALLKLGIGSIRDLL